MKTVFYQMAILFVVAVISKEVYSQGVIISTDEMATPDPSAMLDVQSIEKGMLVPRMTQSQRNAISEPASGLLIYQINQTRGFYFNTGTPELPNWQPVGYNTIWRQFGDDVYRFDGKVGIGLTSPAGKFHVSEPGEWLGITFTGTGLNDLSVDRSEYDVIGATAYAIRIQNSGTIPNMIVISMNGGSTWTAPIPIVNPIDMGNGVTASFGSNAGHTFGDRWDWTVNASYDDVLLVSEGNVGIGLTNPTRSLDVNGHVRIRGGNPAAGKVLTSDADGVGFWSAPMLELPYNQAIQHNGSAFHILNSGNLSLATAIHGESTSSDGVTIGGFFENNSNAGTGVYGWAKALTGPTVGGYFESNSNSGYGSINTGHYGASGFSPNSGGRGVYGNASAVSGTSYGGYFESSSTSGIGVYGLSTAASGTTFGGYFETSSASGRGLYAVASSNSGTNYAIRAQTNSSDGYSGYFLGGRFYVSGNAGFGTTSPDYRIHVSNGSIYATSSNFAIRGIKTGSGTFPGVWGETESASNNATGVRGFVLSASPGAGSAGVHGRNFGAGSNGVGVKGTHDAGGWGVYGETVSGRGVYGYASSGNVTTYGVYGRADGLQGVGVYGEAVSNSGTGGFFRGRIMGVSALVESTAAGQIFGLKSEVTSTNVSSITFGGHFISNSSHIAYGIHASANAPNLSYAGYFSGDVTVTGTFNNPSDQMFKQNVSEMDSSLEKVLQLTGKTYENNTNDYSFMNLSAGRQYGFIAQDMEKIFPELVNRQFHPGSDPNDKKPTEQREILSYKSINYIGLIPVLTEAIKEQQQIITLQSERIDELVNRLSILEQQMQK